MRRIWKEYFGDLYNINTQEHVAFHICGFGEIRRDNYFGGEPIGRAEVDLRVGSPGMVRLQVRMKSLEKL